MNYQKTFFQKLLDLSFSSFIAPQIIGLLYVLGLIGGVLATLGHIFLALRFMDGLGSIFFLFTTIIFSVLGLLIYAIALRVALESFVAIIRTAENTRILAEDVLSRSANGNESN